MMCTGIMILVRGVMWRSMSVRIDVHRFVNLGEDRRGSGGDHRVVTGVPGPGRQDHLLAGPAPKAASAVIKAAVPEVTATQYLAPMCAANSFSNKLHLSGFWPLGPIPYHRKGARR